MPETIIAQLRDPTGCSADPFTDIICDGARKLIEQAIHAELATLMAAFSKEKLEDGRARLVRHGHLPEREGMTGIGPVPVKVLRVRDRKPGEDKITFTPPILLRYLRKTKSVEELLPWLYLKGVSRGHTRRRFKTFPMRLCRGRNPAASLPASRLGPWGGIPAPSSPISRAAAGRASL